MDNVNQFNEIIRSAENIVFFGGAGVSTESGIPDFRGSNGIYNSKEEDGISPEAMLHINYFRYNPKRFYDYYRSHMLFPDAIPNQAHYALAELEQKGLLSAVITQNIDGLHQKAGSKRVLELHGSSLRNYCTICGKQFGLDKILSSDGIPKCDCCDGIIRPDIVFYGEGLDGEVWAEAEEVISKADVLIVGGTSLTVYPAAGLVDCYNGSHLIIINKTPTPSDGYAELVINEPIGRVFSSIK